MISFKSFWLLQEDNKSEHVVKKLMQHYNIDAQQASNVLQQWLRIKEKAKTEYPGKGILSWNSIELLQQDMDDLIESPEFKKHEKEFNRVAMAHGAEKIFENDDCIIYLVHNKWASIILGKGTKWCISAMERNAWFDYIDPDADYDGTPPKSIFFFLIDKKNTTTITKNDASFTVPIKWAIQSIEDGDVVVWDNADEKHGSDELQRIIDEYHLPKDFDEHLYFRDLKEMSAQELTQLSPSNAYATAKKAGHAIAALEPVIATDLDVAVMYAIHVRKKRFKQIEQKLILSNNEAYRSYYMKAFFKDAPWPKFFALKSQQYLEEDRGQVKSYTLGILLDYSIHHNDAQQEFYLQQLKHHSEHLVIYNKMKWAAYNKKFFPQHWMQAQKIVDDLLLNHDDYKVAANHAIATNKRNELMEQKIAKNGGINYMNALEDYAKHFNLAFKFNKQYSTLPDGKKLMMFDFVNK